MAPPPGNLSLSPVQVAPDKTTVVFRNLPSHLSRSELVSLLDNAGFGNKYDFVYLPTNFRTMTVFGYSIVNFSDPVDAQTAFKQLKGANVHGQEIITEWSNSQQGYDVLVRRYRDSPVMHSNVPEKHKPIILADGCQLPFPPPTEVLQPPRKFAVTQDWMAPCSLSSRINFEALLETILAYGQHFLLAFFFHGAVRTHTVCFAQLDCLSNLSARSAASVSPLGAA
jgi:hypothetical protein